MDYLPINTTVIFTPQSSASMCITVTIIDENIPEIDETFSINLSTGDNLVQFATQSLTVTIPSNDGMLLNEIDCLK